MRSDLIAHYLTELRAVLDGLDTGDLIRMLSALEDAHRNRKHIFTIGNGGSAATANHFACDFGKNAIKDEENRFRIISLAEDICAITAYGNDTGYENIFVQQLKSLMDPGDLLIAVSASGNSPNIIRAAEYARAKSGFVIGLTGFDGGKLKGLSDINIHAATDLIEAVEDVHLVVLHIIVYAAKNSFN